MRRLVVILGVLRGGTRHRGTEAKDSVLVAGREVLGGDVRTSDILVVLVRRIVRLRRRDHERVSGVQAHPDAILDWRTPVGYGFPVVL